MIEIDSYGAGTQSTGLILMGLEGKYGLPRPDYAVFADTGAEPEFIYDYIDYFRKYCSKRYGFEIHVTKKKGPSLMEKLTSTPSVSRNGKFYVSSVPPFFTLNEDGTKGMLMRQCTSDFKTHPVNSFIKKNIDKKEQFRLWMGISFDERERMRISTDKRRINYYPLVENFLNRKQVIDYVLSKGVKKPFRSSCFFCPFHSDRYWRWLKKEHKKEFIKACEFENTVQGLSLKTGNSILKYKVFLHRSCRSLVDINFNVDTQMQFPELIEECEGYCGT